MFVKPALRQSRSLILCAFRPVNKGDHFTTNFSRFFSSSTPVSAMQRAIQLSALSDKDFPSNLSFVEDRAKPEIAGSKDVVVRLTARPVNPSDIHACTGHYANFKPTKFPCVPGFESAGVVEAIGADVQAVKVGQRVTPILGMYAFSGEGTWQQYARCTEFECVPIPDNVPDEVACQYLVNPFTAVGLLECLDVPKGEYVLQTSGNSALGQVVIQYAKHLGVKSISLVRQSAQVEILKALGADEVINITEENVVERVKELTGGKGAYGAIDGVAGGITAELAASVRDGGQVLVVGAMAGSQMSVNVSDVVFRNVRIGGFYMGRWLFGQKPEAERFALFPQVMQWLAEGVIKPPVGPSFDLADFASAIEAATKPGQKGKVILTG
eukprot:jgi/Mesen1/10126/ME000075S09632